MTHDPLCPMEVELRALETWETDHLPEGVICQCELIARIRADERDKTLDDAINLLEEMNCKRLWWDDMLTWCISVNEAIYNIDNLRGKKEGI